MRVFTLLLFAWSLPAAASAPDLYGYGGRAMGMAGVVASHPQGHDAVYHNPAGLLSGSGPRFALGYTLGGQTLEVDGQTLDLPRTSYTHIGAALPLPLGGFLKDRLALGFGFVVPTNTVLHAYLPTPGTPHFAVVGYRAQTVTLQSALALRLSEHLTVGGGFMAMSALKGAIDVAPNAEGRIGSSARDQLVAEYAPVFGALWRPVAPWSVGLVYRGESQARFDLPLNADLGEDFPLPVPILAVNGTAQYDPRQVELEMGWRSGEHRLAVGGAWHWWSRFPQPIADAARPETLPALSAPGFQDRWTLGVSGESTWRGEEFQGAYRAGYRYRPTPAPTQQREHALLDNDRHVLALGHTLRWGAFSWTMAAQVHHLAQRDTESQPLGESDAQGHTHGGQLWILNTELAVDL